MMARHFQLYPRISVGWRMLRKTAVGSRRNSGYAQSRGLRREPFPVNPGCRALGANPAGNPSSSMADALHARDLPIFATVVVVHRAAQNLFML